MVTRCEPRLGDTRAIDAPKQLAAMRSSQINLQRLGSDNCLGAPRADLQVWSRSFLDRWVCKFNKLLVTLTHGGILLW